MNKKSKIQQNLMFKTLNQKKKKKHQTLNLTGQKENTKVDVLTDRQCHYTIFQKALYSEYQKQPCRFHPIISDSAKF